MEEREKGRKEGTEMSEVIQENWMYFLAMYVAVFGWVIYKAVFANRGKIKVRIKGQIEKTEWKKWDEIGPVFMEKPKGKKVGWHFTIPSGALFFTKGWFGRLFKTVEVYPDAKQAVIRGDPENPALWDAEHEQALFEAQVIKAAGASTQKIQVPTMLYIGLFVNILLSFIILLVSSGRVRIF